MSEFPKVSVITVVLNNRQFVHTAIESVLAQTYPNLEYIIKDGGSTDGTLDVLAKYKDRCVVLSSKDSGMYDALNQGIESATGEIIAFLHADDFYVTADCIAHMIEAMKRSGADVGWGDLLYVDRNDTTRVIRRWKSSPYAPGKFLRGWHPPHPTFFVRKKVYEKCGVFRTDMSIAADYELMLRFLERNRLSYCYLPETLVTMRVGGRSNRFRSFMWRARLEDARAWRLNGLRGGALATVLKPLSKLRQFLK
jgi:glycosyltransferase